jgi:hypothetical protein
MSPNGNSVRPVSRRLAEPSKTAAGTVFGVRQSVPFWVGSAVASDTGIGDGCWPIYTSRLSRRAVAPPCLQKMKCRQAPNSCCWCRSSKFSRHSRPRAAPVVSMAGGSWLFCTPMLPRPSRAGFAGAMTGRAGTQPPTPSASVLGVALGDRTNLASCSLFPPPRGAPKGRRHSPPRPGHRRSALILAFEWPACDDHRHVRANMR